MIQGVIILSIIAICLCIGLAISYNKIQEKSKEVNRLKDATTIMCSHTWVLTGDISGREYMAKCTTCHNKNRLMMKPDDGYKYCPDCGGKGELRKVAGGAYSGSRRIVEREDCETCNCSGQVPTIETRIKRLEEKANEEIQS